MASFATTSPVVFFLLMLSGEANNMLTTLCARTIDPAFCLNTYQSEPRAATDDIPGLTAITVDLAEKKANATLNLINSSLAKQPTIDPILKQKYEQCVTCYTKIIDTLKKAKPNIASRNYQLLADNASNALQSIETCEDSVRASQAAPEISVGSLDTLKLCNMVFTCVDQILG